jgi:hypothetical protein
MELTGMATADASCGVGQHAAGTGEVRYVEPAAADTTGDEGATGAAKADPFILLAACQIDPACAAEMQADMSQTGASLGLDAATLGRQGGTANQ